MAETRELLQGFFKKVINSTGKDVFVTLPFTEFFQNEPEKNVLLFTRGYLFSNGEMSKKGEMILSDKTVLPKDLKYVKLSGEEHDEPWKFLIYYPQATEVKEIASKKYNSDPKTTPIIEMQELLDSGWKQLGSTPNGSVFTRSKPHAVCFPNNILKQPKIKALIEELS